MKKLYLKGYLRNYDNEWCFENANYYNLSDELYEFSRKNNFCIAQPFGVHTYGGYDIVIPNCNLRIYATNDRSTLDEAQTYLLGVFDGLTESDIYYWGYSEYTIVGLAVHSLTIGGHDLKEELKQYIGKYVHFVLEVK